MVTRLTASIVACMYMAPKKAQSPKTNLYQRNTPTELPFMRLLLRNRGRFTSEDFFCLLKANVCLFKFFVLFFLEQPQPQPARCILSIFSLSLSLSLSFL